MRGCLCVCMCVCVCVCVYECVCVRAYALRIVSTNKILLFLNTLIITIIYKQNKTTTATTKNAFSLYRADNYLCTRHNTPVHHGLSPFGEVLLSFLFMIK